METIDMTLIGKYLRSIRLKKGLSQAKLEKISGVSASTISNIETGNQGAAYNISLQNIIKIAHALDISFIQLLSKSGFLLAIGEESSKSDKSEIYITNHELINIFNRLGPSQQQHIVELINKQIKISDQENQKKLLKK